MRPTQPSLRTQLGSVLISSFEGTSLPPYMRKRLRRRETAGVILFAKNAPDAQSTRRLTRSIQRAAGGHALVVTDDEQYVHSLPFATSPETLRSVGVNVALGPVADVAKPGSVMTGRAFSGDVGEQVAEAVKDDLDGGVLPAAKHFPGLGRAHANTDDAPVTIDATRAELESDLQPFRAAIRAGAPLVMASHALYPALDRSRIASQSKPIIDDLLGGKLGFDGAVITDSMEAEAVLARSSVEAAAERSLAAGADLILLTGPGSWIRVFPYVLKRARHSAALRAQIADSVERVHALRRLLD